MPRQAGQWKRAADSQQEGSILGKSLLIKGQVHGAEPVYIDGQIEGTIDLPENRVVLGRHAKVTAQVTGSEVIVSGTFRGKIVASDRLELRSDGSLTGDVVASRIVIEDGALYKGSIDIRRPEPKMPNSRPKASTQKAAGEPAVEDPASAALDDLQEETAVASSGAN
jgi:cytoskeletal protein CcmA (bactofilin family)